MKLYPYGLKSNPYPSSPTPSYSECQILGGMTHKDAREAIVTCISDLFAKVNGSNSTDKDFRLITMIQDVGSGKPILHITLRVCPTWQKKLLLPM